MKKSYFIEIIKILIQVKHFKRYIIKIILKESIYLGNLMQKNQYFYTISLFKVLSYLVRLDMWQNYDELFKSDSYVTSLLVI